MKIFEWSLPTMLSTAGQFTMTNLQGCNWHRDWHDNWHASSMESLIHRHKIELHLYSLALRLRQTS